MSKRIPESSHLLPTGTRFDLKTHIARASLLRFHLASSFIPSLTICVVTLEHRPRPCEGGYHERWLPWICYRSILTSSVLRVGIEPSKAKDDAHPRQKQHRDDVYIYLTLARFVYNYIYYITRALPASWLLLTCHSYTDVLLSTTSKFYLIRAGFFLFSFVFKFCFQEVYFDL